MVGGVTNLFCTRHCSLACSCRHLYYWQPLQPLLHRLSCNGHDLMLRCGEILV